MPTVYRSMKRAADGLPVLESSARGLGVREPPAPDADIDVDAAGNVERNGKGMSVARNWRDLPRHRIPKRLNNGQEGGLGPNSNFCWRYGDGPFAPGLLAVGLELVLKPHDPTKGNVVPSLAVPLTHYQADLEATRDGWVVDET